MCVYMYIYIYMCVNVCIHVYKQLFMLSIRTQAHMVALQKAAEEKGSGV
jgi:hypothetical protein